MKQSFINEERWAITLTRFLRSLMARHGYTYKQLSEELESKYGIEQSQSNLKAKINKGNFGAQLLLMCISVMSVDKITCEEIEDAYKAAGKK